MHVGAQLHDRTRRTDTRPAWCAGRFCELYDSLWNRLNVAGRTGAALQSPGGAHVAGVPLAALVSLQCDVADLSANLQARACLLVFVFMQLHVESRACVD